VGKEDAPTEWGDYNPGVFNALFFTAHSRRGLFLQLSEMPPTRAAHRISLPSRAEETKISNALQVSIPVKIFGVILIVIGILAMAIPSLPITRKEKILDIGPIEAVVEKKETISLSPFLGLTAIAAGAAMMLAAVITKKR